MSFYSYDPESDKITRVKGEVNKAKSVMMENIDKVRSDWTALHNSRFVQVIQRGESIEVLVDKTERLDMSSQTFKVKSKALERKMCCKNAKLTAILIGVGVVLFLIILFVILWKTGALSGAPAETTTTQASTATTLPATTPAPTTAPATTIGNTTLATTTAPNFGP